MKNITVLMRKNKRGTKIKMRIISGRARGTILNTLEGETTRPTLDRVKESLFSIIQNKILDATVLDLFAGSGALAIESLSRGAKEAVLCDKSIDAIKVINFNLEKTRLKDKATVIKGDYEKTIEKLKQNNKKFNLIFIDPPYKLNIAVKATKQLIENEMLFEDGIIIIETDDEKRELEELKKENINIYDFRQYGRVKLLFISKKGN